jgi:hypothetical protein
MYEILKSPNYECMEYKVEHGDSIQKHILRVYLIKCSNLGTVNASIISWSAAESKMEHCNLLDALPRSNLAT